MMAHKVFLLNKLRDGVIAADYENWVREVAFPFARSMRSIRSYAVTRLDGVLEGPVAPPFDFLEVVDVTDIEEYKAELSPDSPRVQVFDDQWLRFIAETMVLYGEVVTEGA